MDTGDSMNGTYWKTCSKDITSSAGWFRRILTLGLIRFIPIFGSMTVFGFAYEWAHKAAWGVASPLPERIYGRPQSKLVRWGALAWVIAFVFGLIPSLCSAYDSFASVFSVGHNMMGSRQGLFGSLMGIRVFGVTQVIMWFLACVLSVFAWIGTMRMTMYDRLDAGFQLGQILKMARHDLGGLLRIFGMNLLFSVVVTVLFIVLVFFVTILAVVLAVLLGLGVSESMYSSSYSAVYSNSVWSVIGVLALLAVIGLPMYLICIYLLFVASSWIQILTARAVGYWMRQFDVAHWGRKEDPLPFERKKPGMSANAAAQQAVSGEAPSSDDGAGAGAGSDVGADGGEAIDTGAAGDVSAAAALIAAASVTAEGEAAAAGDGSVADTPAAVDADAGADAGAELAAGGTTGATPGVGADEDVDAVVAGAPAAVDTAVGAPAAVDAATGAGEDADAGDVDAAAGADGATGADFDADGKRSDDAPAADSGEADEASTEVAVSAKAEDGSVSAGIPKPPEA